MTNELKTDRIYHFGDFIISPNDNGTFKIRSDKGILSVRPNTDNTVTLISSINSNEIHGK